MKNVCNCCSLDDCISFPVNKSICDYFKELSNLENRYTYVLNKVQNKLFNSCNQINVMNSLIREQNILNNSKIFISSLSDLLSEKYLFLLK